MSTNYIDQITDTAGTTHDISEGDSTRIFRATCTTAAGTTAKVATLDTSNRNFSLTTGVRVAVTFKYGNSATTPTLRVDGSSTGTAKTIASATAVATRTTGNGTTYNTWGPYETVIFTYDGTYWVQSGSSLSIYNAYALANSKTANTGTITEVKTIAGTHSTIDVTSGKAEFNVPTKTSHLTNDSNFVTSSGVTSIATSSPISGGTITTTGTISHATSGVGDGISTAGFYKFKYDTYGHVTGVSAVTASDITGLVTIPDVSGKIDTAGTGLSKSGTTLNHSNSVTAQTTQAVYPIKIDAQGHISAYGSAVTIPDISGKLDVIKNTPNVGTHGINYDTNPVYSSADDGLIIYSYNEEDKSYAQFDQYLIAFRQFPDSSSDNNPNIFQMSDEGIYIHSTDANEFKNLELSFSTGGSSNTSQIILDSGGTHIYNVVTPTNNTDAANKKYVDDRTVDYVVETSSDSYWRWVKWNSGRVELWGWFSQSVSAYATNSFVIGSSSVTPFPFTISEPRTIVSGQRIGTGGCVVDYDYGRTDYWSGIAHGTINSWAQGSTQTITWTCYINARWK